MPVAPFFDSHAHLDDPDWPPARLVADLRSTAGWLGSVSAGYGPERFAAGRAVVAALPAVRRAVGLHPWWLADHAESARAAAWQQVIAELDQFGEAIVALGELGVDKNRKAQMPAADQVRWLAIGLGLARDRDLALVLHVVGWHGHALQTLRAVGGPWRGVVHRFSGSPAVADQYQQLGLHVSVALEPRFDPDRRAAVARAIAPERLVVESDWPFKDLNYPASLDAVRALADDLGTARAEPGAALLARSNANCATLFGL